MGDRGELEDWCQDQRRAGTQAQAGGGRAKEERGRGAGREEEKTTGAREEEGGRGGPPQQKVFPRVPDQGGHESDHYRLAGSTFPKLEVVANNEPVSSLGHPLANP